MTLGPIEIGNAYLASCGISDDMVYLLSAKDATEPTTRRRIERVESQIVRLAHAFGYKIERDET